MSTKAIVKGMALGVFGMIVVSQLAKRNVPVATQLANLAR